MQSIETKPRFEPGEPESVGYCCCYMMDGESVGISGGGRFYGLFYGFPMDGNGRGLKVKKM
jgi:hypothetical protein